MEIAVLVLCAINMFLIIKLIMQNKNERADKEFKDMNNLLLKIYEKTEKLDGDIKDEFLRNRQESSSSGMQGRVETSNLFKNMTYGIQNELKTMSDVQKRQIDTLLSEVNNLTGSNEQRLNKMRDTIEVKLEAIQNDNNKKLDEMRATVDEKLHESLEKRLGESFASISERLEKLYKQLGEIGSLANGVNDLKRALSNVKVRGTFGEIQLQAILDDILTKEQYDVNAVTKTGSNERVEFAIKIPAKDESKSYIYLPIDSKFPQEDYQRLLDAEEAADKNLINECRKALITRMKSEASDIKNKYIDPPNTTDFGLLFLPTESLYAEAVKEPGFMEFMQKNYKVVITGPSTISAFLNSLQMGFRTLAIEKRSSEVWRVLGAVKTEFTKFGDMLDKTQKKLQEASNTIETASKKSKTIERKLKSVEELPVQESEKILS